MGALARLSASVIDVDPGTSVSLELTVRNTGTVVDQFSFEVLGVAAPWARAEPPTVSLFPQAEQTVQVIFLPPRAADTASGPVPFGIRVVSHEDPEGSVVEEGTLIVAPFSDVVAELTPRAIRLRHRGRVQFLVDNRSNISYQAELVGSDDSEAFGYVFSPPLVDVAPGAVAFAKLTVRAKERYWRGPSTTQPFQVMLRQQHVADEALADGPSGAHPVAVPADGAVLRDAILPGWLSKAAAVLAALLLVAALLWFKLVKPQITAAAQNQVAKQVKPMQKELTKLAVASSASNTVPPPATTTTVAPSHPTTTVVHKPPAGAGSPVNANLVTAGDNSMASYTVPKGKTLEVTDILLENSAGYSGDISLERSGVVLMSWSLANFRDLDYHWITPIYFGSKSQMELAVTGCQGACDPALYYAGTMEASR